MMVAAFTFVSEIRASTSIAIMTIVAIILIFFLTYFQVVSGLLPGLALSFRILL